MARESSFIKASLIAAGKGTTVGGTLSLANGYQLGCVIARTGTGVITITLDAAVGFAVAGSYALQFQCDTVSLQGIVADTSASVKTVTMQTAAGAATESAFTFLMWRMLTR